MALLVQYGILIPSVAGSYLSVCLSANLRWQSAVLDIVGRTTPTREKKIDSKGTHQLFSSQSKWQLCLFGQLQTTHVL